MPYSNIGTAKKQSWVEVTSQDLRDLCGITNRVEYRDVLRRNHKHDNPKTKGFTIMAPAKKTTTTADIDIMDVVKALHATLGNFIGEASVTEAPVKSKAKPAKAVEPDEEEAEEEEASPEDARREELGKKTLAQLKKIAIAAGFTKDDVADADEETLIESIIDDEFSESDEDEDEDEEESDDEESDDDEGEEEEDEEESEGYTEEDLQPLSLTALKKEAVKVGYDKADLAGYDKEEVIALLLGDDEEEGDEEEEDEEDGYDEDDLKAMSLAELKKVAKEAGVKMKPGMKKPELIKAILA